MRILLIAALLVGCGALRPRPVGSSDWQSVFEDCDAGDNAACFWVASTEMKSDLPSAIARFTRACDAGVGEACMELASLAEDGEGMPKDLPKHVAWLERACDLGSARGCSNLGVAWFKGLGVEKRPEKSTPLYERACKLGDALACSNFATALNDGRSGYKDVPRARALWREACVKESNACELLSQELEKDGDQEAATHIVREGCRHGHSRSCEFVAYDLKKSKPAEALRYARSACSDGRRQSCHLTMELSRTNKTLWPETHLLAKRLCDEGDGDDFVCVEALDLTIKRGGAYDDAGYAKWCPANSWACHQRCRYAANNDKTSPLCVDACKAGHTADCASPP